MSIRGPGSGKSIPLKKLVTRTLAVVLVIIFFVWQLTPVEEKIRLGTDLKGGVSLIYQVEISDDAGSADTVMGQVITVLKDRVNPKGVFDITFQPMGQNRLEIIMPLPGEQVVALREVYEGVLLQVVNQTQINGRDLQAALEAGEAATRFGARGGKRKDNLQELQELYDDHQAAVAAHQTAKAAGAEQDVIGPLAQAVADADVVFAIARKKTLEMSLDTTQLERMVRLSTDRPVVRDDDGQIIFDPATREAERSESPREIEIESLAVLYPELIDDVATLVSAYDAYADKREGFDDPEDLMRLLRGAGVLEFRVAVGPDEESIPIANLRTQLAERGAAHTDSPLALWLPVNDLKQWYKSNRELAALQRDPQGYFAGRGLVAAERDGTYYILLHDTHIKSLTHAGGTQWAVIGTSPSVDGFGRPAVGFRLDGPGGQLMNAMTGRHVGEPMAIVLDGQVYSAPNINSAIGSSGIIVGNFSQAEINYLIRVLAAGSLQAQLDPEPIAINTLGPSIGKDNLARGLEAFKVAIIAVAIFMFLYYFVAGLVADLALLANGVIIFGFMAMIDGTFTLPGLAGIVLTIGMAVDANVLIYERIREEIFGGETDLRNAIKLGYAKALSTIVDANVTNLIVCGVLYQTATTEVKGFALTLSIGICATLFTALIVTRIIYHYYTDICHFKRLPMLPTVVPAIHRMLEPSINWFSLRKGFWAFSIVAMGVSIVLISIRGVNMFDTQFRGGVSAIMRTAVSDPDAAVDSGQEPRRHLLGELEVQSRIRDLSSLLAPGADSDRLERLLASLRASEVIDRTTSVTDPAMAPVRTVLAELANAAILTVGTTQQIEGVIHGDRFQIKVASPKGLSADGERAFTDTVIAAIVAEFGDVLDITRSIDFVGAGDAGHEQYTRPINDPTLGRAIGRPGYTDRVDRFLGGVVVLVDDIDPPVREQELEDRIKRMRSQPDFSAFIGRDVGIFGLDPADPTDTTAGYRSIAVCVADPDISYLTTDFEVWDDRVAGPEWQLVSAALHKETSLEEVTSFSSAVAATLSANAVVAVVLSILGILLYIWVRFGSLRYSIAAIIALIHDVTIALGLLALSAWLGTGFGKTLLIEEFRIDLGVVAALLTIIGYSLNDTIVILDRIRENRGKLPIPTAAIVNDSINQTISRTVLTSTTTLLAVGIMYAAGGTGIRPFAYCLLAGLVVGTYSSVAIAAPLVVRSIGGKAEGAGDDDAGSPWRPEETA